LTYVVPRTSVELQLAHAWAEVLGLNQVGIHDSFFDLGGHSLRATQIISRVQKLFRVELSMRTLFEVPTVEGLAQRSKQMRFGANSEAG
jgi:acyl carrier protein